MSPTPVDITGRRFGLLLAIEQAGRKHGEVTWRCRCDCGGEAVVQSYNLRCGNTQSCGCASSRVTLGDRSQTHGRSGTVEYDIWAGIIKRTNNPKATDWKHYGGRGIKVSSAFRGPGGFERFLAEIGPRPSLRHTVDRIDNDGDYEPGNIRWATWEEQANNRRRAA